MTQKEMNESYHLAHCKDNERITVAIAVFCVG